MKSLSVSKGNMYSWVSHMWSPIRGCPHQCAYCYAHPAAEPKLLPKPWPALGMGRVIFVGHLCDMWAEAVGDFMIRPVLEHCLSFPSNDYVFQTKNPERIRDFIEAMPQRHIVGTTIETNRQDLLDSISHAPAVFHRSKGLREIKGRKFLTIEPILDFDLEVLADLVVNARPDFVNIGADSKGHHLPEPPRAKVFALINRLWERGIVIRKKSNLERLTV